MCLYMFVYKVKIVTGLPLECFPILTFSVIVARSFPFSCSYVIMRSCCHLIDVVQSIKKVNESISVAVGFSSLHLAGEK